MIRRRAASLQLSLDIEAYLKPRALEINKGNKQIANRGLFVLHPLDL